MNPVRKSVSWRHPHECGEPALGFSSRLAALNGRSLRELLREMMVPRWDLYFGAPTAISAVAAIGAADYKRLTHFSPVFNSQTKTASIGTEILKQTSVRRIRFFYCPHCIADDLGRYSGPVDARPWLRMEWIVSHFRSCNRHNAFLLSVPAPKVPNGSFDFAAEMRVILRDLTGICASTISAPHSPFQDWLRARLDGKRDPENWLDTIELYAAVDFCEALGLSARAHLHPPIRTFTNLHSTRSRTLPVEELAAAADEGFLIARQGEASLEKFFDRLASSQLNFFGPWGLRDTFGCVYELLNTTDRDKAFEQPRDALRRFILKTIPIAAGKIVLGHTLKEPLVHSVRSIAVATGIHEYTIRHLLEDAGLIDPAISATRDNRTVFPMEAVRSFLAELSASWTTTRIKDVTGIPDSHMRYIATSGKIQKIVDPENSRHKTLYSNASVQELFARFFGNAIRVKEPSDRHVSPARAHAATGIAISDIIDLLYEGRIWIGSTDGETDYSTLLVDADEILKIVGKDRKLGYNQAELAVAMGLTDKQAVPALLSAGHLTTVRQFCPAARRMIDMVPHKSLEAFRKLYISNVEIASAAGLHFRTVLRALDRDGLKPAINRDKFFCTFFSRAEVDELLSRDGHSW